MFDCEQVFINPEKVPAKVSGRLDKLIEKLNKLIEKFSTTENFLQVNELGLKNQLNNSSREQQMNKNMYFEIFFGA